ncbi:MAG: metalloregulator ArsR/SmtB family transcription factor [Desulfobacteraceae bacterium]
MREFIKVMKALADPNRVRMVKLLQHRVLCVCEIQAALGLAQSTASKHLKILEDAGLITYLKEGPWVNYRLADGARNPYVASLLGNLRHWLEDDKEVAALVARV